jgi:CubicO group peptidase (beta-lactamase class C family)
VNDEQLAALAEVADMLGRERIEYWLLGGWAVDFHLGLVTREHDDVDLAVWRRDGAAIASLLGAAGWRHAPEAGEDGGTGYERGAVRVELTYVESDGDVVVVPLSDRHAVLSDTPLGDEELELLGVRARVLSLAVLRAGKSRPRDDPAAAAKDLADAQALALPTGLDALAAMSGFSGVVHVDGEVTRAYGLAHRALEIPNTADTQFAIASGTKGLTALAVVSLIEEGRLELSTPARGWLGDDLPLIREDVTIEHLLAHRSGIGDYLDEEQELELSDYLMPVPVHELATTEQYLAILDAHPHKFAPDERFAYCNSGYVVLALIAERAGGLPFHEVVRDRVCAPAAMRATEFLRSDELPGSAALGYLEVDGVWRTNVFHLPVRGSGDGGIYTTVGDVSRLWDAFFAGRIVSERWVREMVRPRSDVPSQRKRYGLGFWLHAETDAVMLEGCDAGASFLSVHDRQRSKTSTVVSNTSDGAWPVARYLLDR